MPKFIVHTKPDCPHCDRAKNAIKVKGHEYEERVYSTAEEIEMFKAQGFRSFPMVYHGDTFVGTADHTESYLSLLNSDDDF